MKKIELKKLAKSPIFWIGLGVIVGGIFLFLFHPKSSSKDVLARVGRKVITAEDFQKRIDALPGYYRSFAAENKKVFLDDLINQELLFQAAKKKRVLKDKEVRKLIEEFAKGIVIRKYVEKEVLGKIKVTEDELLSYYKDHRSEFTSTDSSPSFPEVKDRIEKIIRNEKEERAYRDCVKKLRDRANIRTNTPLLSQIK